MKKTKSFIFIISISLLICVFAFVGCAGTQNTQNTNAASKTMTIDEALQKSAETRKKISDTKASIEAAKKANETKKDSSSAIDEATKKAKESFDAGLKKLEEEKEAWKQTLSN